MNVNFRHLERTTDRESKTVPLTRKKNARQLVGKTKRSARIVKVDQPERHIHDWHLNPKLDPDAGPVVTDLTELSPIYVKK